MAKHKRGKRPTSGGCWIEEDPLYRPTPRPRRAASTACPWPVRWGQDPASVFKTLVARGASGGYYVFDIPVAATLDLKKAAHAVGEKSVAMLPQKELLPLTGYVHGGCSPVGMKKLFPTVFHETAASLPVIMVSAGKLGHQIACDPKALLALVRADTADIITEG